MTIKLIALLMLSLITFSACNPMGGEKFKVDFKNPSAFKDLKVEVTSVALQSNQLIISGTSLNNIKAATLKNNSQEEIFQIESASENQIIANGTKAMSIIAGSVFDLILSDAYGSATFQVTFSLNDNAVTTAKILDGAVTGEKIGISASAGQFLKYNGTTWVAASVVDGQTYMGTWDASSAVFPALSTPGDYYIVSVAGTFGTPAVSYAAGDWIITDGYNWQKVGYSKSVSSFQGRKGIVTLQASDYVSLKDTTSHKLTGSSLNDLFDVNLTVAPTNGQILKWNAASVKPDGSTGAWEAGTDSYGSGGIALTNLSAVAPIVYNNTTGAFSLTPASITVDGSMSAADKTKLDGLTAIPTTGDGLIERFSGALLMRTCGAGEMLIWLSPAGWTCSSSIALSGLSTQTLGMGRNTTADTAGNNLTVAAGGATASATDKSGGNLILSSGTSTGTGSSSIQFQTSTASSSGTTDNTASTKMTILGSGNVGIGTTNPSATLTVAKGTGLMKVMPGWYTGSVGTWIDLDTTGPSGIGTGGAGANPWMAYVANSGNWFTGSSSGDIAYRNTNGKKIHLGIDNGSGTASPTATITGSNVGIGITNPTAPLHVYQNTNSDLVIHTQNGYAGKGTYIRATAASSNYTGFESAGGAVTWRTGLSGTTNFSVLDLTDSTWPFQIEKAAPSNSLYIKANGNVGIGTASPAPVWAGRKVLQIEDTSGNGSELQLNSTTAKFRIFNSNSNVGFGSDTANDIFFFTNSGSNDRLHITSAGNVGIGTATPTSLFSVGSTSQFQVTSTGTMATTGSVTVGGNITQNGNVTGASLGGITGTLNANNAFQSQLIQNQASIIPQQDITGTLYGMIFLPTISSSASNIANVKGIFSRTDLAASYTGTINDYSGFVSSEPVISGGSITNMKGYTSTISSGTNKYNIYASGTAQNYFAGNVGIGTSTPIAGLDVAGTIRAGTGPSTLTTLTSAATSTDTTINVADTSLYPARGVLYSTTTQEVIFYTGKTSTSFTGLTRGRYASTAAALSSGATLDYCLLCISVNDTSTPRIFNSKNLGMAIGGLPPTWSSANSLYVGGNLFVGNLIQASNGISFGTSSTSISAFGSSSASDYLRFITNNAERVRVDGSGNVGIGITVPTEKLHVVGNILATGTVTGSSDIRLKKNIRPITDALQKLDSIIGVKYYWIDPYLHTEGEQIGVIAQDVEKVFPQAVLTSRDGLKSVSYMGLVAPVIQAIKELHEKIKGNISRLIDLEEKDKDKDKEILELKNRLIRVEAENTEIKTRLLNLEKHLKK